MKLFKYILLVNLTLACPISYSFAVDTDQSKIQVLEQQANSGDADAQFKLGSKYYQGKSVPQDYSKAIEYFTKAGDQGDSDALYNLGRSCRKFRM